MAENLDWRAGLAVVKERAAERDFDSWEESLFFVIALQLEELLNHQTWVQPPLTG
jgi:hypothetical protein